MYDIITRSYRVVDLVDIGVVIHLLRVAKFILRLGQLNQNTFCFKVLYERVHNVAWIHVCVNSVTASSNTVFPLLRRESMNSVKITCFILQRYNQSHVTNMYDTEDPGGKKKHFNDFPIGSFSKNVLNC